MTRPFRRSGSDASRPAAFAFGLYVLIVVATGAANLGAQALTLHLFPAGGLFFPMLVGTALGFAAKYGLDKFLFFKNPYDGHAEEIRKVGLYGSISVLTTLVFWSFETAAWFLTQSQTLKYFGGAVGLAVGNLLKYHLDRRFVFKQVGP